VLIIGREAITNAFAHAEARRIEVEVIYSAKSLAVRIRDDGKGLDGEVAQAERPDHWGIVGRRERARHLGARLHIWSRPGSGTEMELTVPAAVAYAAKSDAHGRGR
jgi:signal transduction histidine kinase